MVVDFASTLVFVFFDDFATSLEIDFVLEVSFVVVFLVASDGFVFFSVLVVLVATFLGLLSTSSDDLAFDLRVYTFSETNTVGSNLPLITLPISFLMALYFSIK